MLYSPLLFLANSLFSYFLPISSLYHLLSHSRSIPVLSPFLLHSPPFLPSLSLSLFRLTVFTLTFSCNFFLHSSQLFWAVSIKFVLDFPRAWYLHVTLCDISINFYDYNFAIPYSPIYFQFTSSHSFVAFFAFFSLRGTIFSLFLFIFSGVNCTNKKLHQTRLGEGI